MTGVHTIYQGKIENALRLVPAVGCIRNILILERRKIFMLKSSDDQECQW
jgi:hypothetical protein